MLIILNRYINAIYILLNYLMFTIVNKVIISAITTNKKKYILFEPLIWYKHKHLHGKRLA